MSKYELGLCRVLLVVLTWPSSEAAKKDAPRRRSKMSAAAAADLAAAKAAFDAYIGDAATETWPVEDLLPLSLRATFLSSSSAGKQKLLKQRLYAYPAAAFDPLVTLSGGKVPIVENAFTMFERHVKSFTGCAARRVKIGLLNTPYLSTPLSIRSPPPHHPVTTPLKLSPLEHLNDAQAEPPRETGARPLGASTRTRVCYAWQIILATMSKGVI